MNAPMLKYLGMFCAIILLGIVSPILLKLILSLCFVFLIQPCIAMIEDRSGIITDDEVLNLTTLILLLTFGACYYVPFVTLLLAIIVAIVGILKVFGRS